MTSPTIIRAAIAALPEATVRKLVDALIVEDVSLVNDELDALLEKENETEAAPPVEPPVVVDADGDAWLRIAEGLYAFRSYGPHTLDKLRDTHGPLTIPGTPV